MNNTEPLNVKYLTLTEASDYAAVKKLTVAPADLLRAGTHGTLKLCASFGLSMWRIPTAFLLPIETEGSAQVDLVFHLDPTSSETLYPRDVRTIDQLRVMVSHLDEFLSTVDDSMKQLDAPKNKKRPPPQQRFQETEILRVIRGLGFTPKALPKHKTGHKGTKSAVYSHLDWSDSVFKKAWERLRDAGEIQRVDEIKQKT